MNARLLAAALGVAAPLSLLAETPNPSGRTTADVLAQLETFAVTAMAQEKVPGMAYAVVKDGQVVFAKGYGKRRLGDATDGVTSGTLFEIGSTTKAFTSALVAMEVEAGKISWDDRVVDVLPDFRMYDPWVTAEFRVCDLMSQRSGMPAYAIDSMPYLGFGRADVGKALRYVEPTYSFRNGFAYVNNLWLTAGRLVEKLEGTTWEEALSRRILEPLGMRETTVDPQLVKLVADRATGHSIGDSGVLAPISDDWPFADVIDIIGPAGSIRSTVLDFARWATFQLARGTLGTTTLLSPATVDALHAPRTFIAAGGGLKAISYALGWMHEEYTAGTIVWHNGASPGQHSIISLYERPNVALVVLTNTATNEVPERMRIELFDLLQVPPGGARTHVGREIVLDWPARPRSRPAPLAPIPPFPLERYVGTYENPAYGRVTVELRSGTLFLSAGPRPVSAPLVPWSGHRFTWRAQLDEPPVNGYVTFTVPSGQSASQFVATAFQDVRGGLFTRTQ